MTWYTGCEAPPTNEAISARVSASNMSLLSKCGTDGTSSGRPCTRSSVATLPQWFSCTPAIAPWRCMRSVNACSPGSCASPEMPTMRGMLAPAGHDTEVVSSMTSPVPPRARAS